jgi:hypothetical protein
MINLAPEVEAVAKRLAVVRGVSLEDAIRLALEETAQKSDAAAPRPPRDTSPEAVVARRQRTRKFVEELSAMPLLDTRSANEIADDLDAL